MRHILVDTVIPEDESIVHVVQLIVECGLKLLHHLIGIYAPAHIQLSKQDRRIESVVRMAHPRLILLRTILLPSILLAHSVSFRPCTS